MIFRPGMMWSQYLRSEKWHWEAPENFESKSWRPDISKWSLGASRLMARNLWTK